MTLWREIAAQSSKTGHHSVAAMESGMSQQETLRCRSREPSAASKIDIRDVGLSGSGIGLKIDGQDLLGDVTTGFVSDALEHETRGLVDLCQ